MVLVGICSMLFFVDTQVGSVYATNEVDELNEKLNKNKEEQESIDQQIEELNLKIEDLTTRTEEIKVRISDLDVEIDSAKKELSKIRGNIEKNEETLALRLKAINSNYSKTMLEVLLSSNTVSDFFDRLYIIKQVISQDKDILRELKESKDMCEKKELELSKKKSEQEYLKTMLDEETKIIEEDKLKLEDLKKELELEEENLEKDLEKLIIELSAASYDLNLSGYVLSSGGWPIHGYTRISSPYGYRIHPVLKIQKMHTGIDIPAPKGTPTVSIDDGIVIFSGPKGTYGNTIMVQHFDGKVSLYAHNSELVARVGQRVAKGEVVAKVGSTGMSTGNHLHFEIRLGGKHVNPVPFLTME